jgi:hypothetical protein
MFAFATLTALALAASASAFSVTTPPTLELCKEAKWEITGGSATDTYQAYFVNGNEPCGDELFPAQTFTGNTFKWTVNITNVPIMVAFDNGSGDEVWSGSVTVTGSDKSCLTTANAAASSTGGSGVRATTTRAGVTAPVNAASGTPSASDAAANGASRAAFGITSALAVLGAAAVGLSL